MTTNAVTKSLLQRGLPSLFTKSQNPHSPVAVWILTTSGLVASMVHIGGITRLTKSGLSMTDWKPLGSFPPLNESEWKKEFDRYKTYPEWSQRKSMSLDEFRYIYYWEWGHRMLGRVVGLSFALPWTYFAVRGKIPKGYHGRMGTLFALGGTQGLVGWWMVKSGLGENRRDDKKEIRVSPYRLASHLTMAVGTYGLLLWTGLGLLQLPNDTAGTKSGSSSRLMELAKSLTQSGMKHAKTVRSGAIGVTSLTALTIVSGAFVAGNDAGNAYNTYPLMDERLVPWDHFNDPNLVPSYRNLFENTALVQFNHRLLGTSTALSALTLAGLGLARGRPMALTPQVRNGLKFLGTVAVGQMSLGVATLLTYVPLSLAALHQLGSLVVLSGGIYVVHSLRYVSPMVVRSLVGNRGAAAAATGSSLAMSGGGGAAGGLGGVGALGKGAAEMAVKAAKV